MCLMDEDKEAEECNKRFRQSLKLFAKMSYMVIQEKGSTMGSGKLAINYMRRKGSN